MSSLAFLTLTPTPSTTQETLRHAIDVLAARDDRLEVSWQTDEHAVVLGGADDEHLERVMDALKREFSVTADTGRVRVDVRRALVEHPGGRTWVAVEPWMDAEVRSRAFYVPRLRESWPRLDRAGHGGPEDGQVLLRCRAPLAEVFGLRRAVHEMTHDEATATVSFSGHAPRDGDDSPSAPVAT